MKNNVNDAVDSLIKILEKHPIDISQINTLNQIFNSQDNFIMAISYVYNYGIITGKRLERCKNKYIHSDT